MFLIVGLGNPGPRYADTRHNVGFMAVNALAKAKQVPLNKAEHFGLTGDYREGAERVKLVLPQTFMNESGRCVRALADYYKVPSKQIVVIYDDVDLPPGQLRIRQKGGAGTHNGMRSVVGHLGTTDFPRVRIGIGERPFGWDLADYVLSHLSGDDGEAVRTAVEQAARAAALIVSDGVDLAMNRMNVRR